MLWAIFSKKTPLCSFTSNDIEEFKEFLTNPTPKQAWCSLKRKIRTDMDWKPFVSPLSKDSVYALMREIKILFNYLVSTKYLLTNPIPKKSRKKTSLKNVIFMPIIPWSHVKKAYSQLNTINKDNYPDFIVITRNNKNKYFVVKVPKGHVSRPFHQPCIITVKSCSKVETKGYYLMKNIKSDLIEIFKTNHSSCLNASLKCLGLIENINIDLKRKIDRTL